MAETSSSRPLWIAAGAALAGLVVMLAVFAGPVLVSCTSDEAGFGSCVREKMADSGVVPPAGTEAPEVASAGDADGMEAPEAAPDQAEVTAVPELGLVRAEPDGSLVIAGSAEPGSTVEIYSNGELLGTATAESSGDWVLVPETPLPPGGVEITVVDPATDAVSEQSVVVAISEDGTTEPLVVATVPGEADSVLQGLMEQQAEATQVAEADTASEETPAEETSTEEPAADDDERMEVAAADPAEAPEADEPAATPEPEVTEPEAAAEDEATAQEEAAEETPAEDAAAAEDEPAPEEQAAEEEPAAQEEPAQQEDTEVASTDDIVEGVDDLERQLEALTPTVQPTIDAIEIDGGRNFFAGSGEEGATVRLYVDNEHIGDTTVENGRWLLQTDDVLENRSQRVRIDQLAEGSADVVARAEVEFVFEAPEGGTDTAVADAAPQIVRIPSPDFGIDTDAPVNIAGVDDGATATEEQLDVATNDTPVDVPTPDFGIDTDEPAVLSTLDVGEGIAGEQDMAGTGADVNVPSPDFGIDTDAPVDIAEVPATDAGVGDGGDASAQSQDEVTAQATVDVPEPDFSVDTGIEVDIAEDGEQADAVAVAEEAEPAAGDMSTDTEADMAQIDEESGTEEPAADMVAAEMPETSGEDGDVPVLVAEPVGDPRDQRFASGKAIIRHGDNLWTIASRVYGSGYEYLAIYRANKGQIRNPDLIYPGQVFDLPSDGE